MEQNIAFERCVDFLARMIEKYGQELSMRSMQMKMVGQELKQKIQSQRKWVSKMSASIFYILNILKN